MKVIHHLWIYQEENPRNVNFFAAPPPARAAVKPPADIQELRFVRHGPMIHKM
jgi:hypothetical protein